MPAVLQASISSVPFGAVTAFPSTVMFTTAAAAVSAMDVLSSPFVAGSPLRTQRSP